MPFSTMPEEAFRLWEEVYNRCIENGDSKEVAARKAYAALRRAGWYKGDDGKWHKRSAIVEFSLRIEKASFDKKTGEMRWRAVASDTDIDDYGDRMTLELFNKFIERALSKEEPPVMTSDFWKGGMPYLSVSHYPDLNGKGVAGMADALYIDGNRFKAKGYFLDTAIGRAAFNAVCRDLYGDNEKSDKIRISIAFLDYSHRHMADGSVFVRNSIDDVCLFCLNEARKGVDSGLEFLDGHLIHLALTRVPVNRRTSLEVERAMVTRKEDAASIIGEELAEELEKESALVGRSEALVVKSDDESEAEPEVEVRAVTKKEADCEHPASHYLVVEDPDHPSTWHLRVRNCDGELDHRLMGQAWAALHGGFRGNKYSGPNKEEAIRKLERLYEEEGMEPPVSRAEFEQLFSKVDQILSAVTSPEPDEAVRKFSDFMSTVRSVVGDGEVNEEKAEQVINMYLQFGEWLGRYIGGMISREEEVVSLSKIEERIGSIANSLEQVVKRLDMFGASLEGLKERSVRDVPSSQSPKRRSLSGSELSFRSSVSGIPTSPKSRLREIVEKLV